MNTVASIIFRATKDFTSTMRFSVLVWATSAILTTTAFAPMPSRAMHRGQHLVVGSSPVDDDDEAVEPGQMRVSEIRAELEIRGISYDDCFDKESLVQRLTQARENGQADPAILHKFNQQRLEEKMKSGASPSQVVDEDTLQQAVANDGTLPGGLRPEQFQKLTSNPEIMSLLQSTKMQEAMHITMTSGPEELESKLAADPELREVVQKLDGIMKSMQ